MKVLMTGVTGLIGKALCERLKSEGHIIVGLSRSPQKVKGLAVDEMHAWDTLSCPPPDAALDGIDAVIHLAGEPIAEGRWTDAKKKRIRDSRLVSTRNLVEGMRAASSKPSVFLCSSAVGIYGDRGDEELDERAQAGSGFLEDLCKAWEAEAGRARELGIRVVEVRTGVVLATESGALAKMLPAFKMGVAGRLGNGRQWFPWIHLDDIVGLYIFALNTPTLNEPINGVAPESVTNAEFTKQLGKALHRPAFIPVPALGLKLLFGEMAAVLVASQRAIPKTALAAGYKFKYASLAPALQNLVGK
ncbi:MAG: TIGR01777 family oxidoreductase [Acidobacteriota bacterium]